MSTASAPVPRVGCHLGPYVIDGVLGKGGMATVYRAHHRRLRRPVALKVLTPGQDRARFRREGKLLARFRHPGVAQVLDCGREGELVWYAMPVYTFPTLADLLEAEGGRLPCARAARIAVSLLGVLEDIHAAGVVHRDIKPANMFVGAGDEVLVCDFGIARPVGACTTLTGAGLVVGSLHYLAPETIEDTPPSVAADLYAAGLTLYRACCGALPYPAELEDVVRAKLLHEITPPGAIFPALDPALEPIIAQACRRAPAERFESATAFRTALRSYLDGLEPAHARRRAGPTLRVPRREARSPVRAAWLAAALACCLMLGRLAGSTDVSGGEAPRAPATPAASRAAVSPSPVAAAGPGALWPVYRESEIERRERGSRACVGAEREARACAVLEKMGASLPRLAIEELMQRSCLASGHARYFLPGSTLRPELDPFGVELALQSMSAARVLESWERARIQGLETIRRARHGLPLAPGAALVDLRVLVGYLCVVQPELYRHAFQELARELGPGGGFSPLTATLDVVEPSALAARARSIDRILTRCFRAGT